MNKNDYSLYYLFSPSPDFVNLCQIQLNLWGQTQKADWSAVYLTQETVPLRNPSLIQIAVDPPLNRGENLLLLGESGNKSVNLPNLSPSESSELTEKWILEGFDDISSHQVVLPLIYQERVLGLLVTRRQGQEWQSAEIRQGEKIAQTLAIACWLDQRQQGYQQQLQQQQQFQQWEDTQIDNLLHQLRNPLTAIRTFSKLLLRQLGNDPKIQSAVQGVIRESDRLQDLLKSFEKSWKNAGVDNLNDKPLLTGANLPLMLPSATMSLEAVNLQELLNPLLESARAIAQEKAIQLKAELPEDEMMIKGNMEALREVFTNLLDNALKYTPTGGKIGVIGLSDQEKEWGIAIADTGYGIPSEDIKHIFERNYRGIQEKGNIQGTGLGLAIVKDYIEQMKGRIDCISPNGLTEGDRGTTFRVWIPKDKP